ITASATRTGSTWSPKTWLCASASVLAERIGQPGNELPAKGVLSVLRDHRQVTEHSPQLAPFVESVFDRPDLLIRREDGRRGRLEVVDERQVDLRMAEVGRGVDHYRAAGGADEVVLLGVAVQQARRRLRAV